MHQKRWQQQPAKGVHYRKNYFKSRDPVENS